MHLGDRAWLRQWQRPGRQCTVLPRDRGCRGPRMLSTMPWVSQRSVASIVVAVPTPTCCPPEAAQDAARWRAAMSRLRISTALLVRRDHVRFLVRGQRGGRVTGPRRSSPTSGSSAPRSPPGWRRRRPSAPSPTPSCAATRPARCSSSSSPPPGTSCAPPSAPSSASPRCCRATPRTWRDVDDVSRLDGVRRPGAQGRGHHRRCRRAAAGDRGGPAQHRSPAR